jgi:hypothetical protein
MRNLSKLLGISVCCLLLAVSSIAQDADFKCVTLKIAPIKLVAFEPNLSFSVERRMANRLGFQIQTDYIFYRVVFDGEPPSFQYNGVRIFPEMRYYFSKKASEGYIGMNMMGKFTREKFEEFVTATNSSGITFQRLIPFSSKKRALAMHALIGYQFYIDKEDRINIDMNFGAGLRYKSVDGFRGSDQQLSFFYNDFNRGPMISAVANLKIGYSIFR